MNKWHLVKTHFDPCSGRPLIYYMIVIIDREARVMMYLVASVCPSVSVRSALPSAEKSNKGH